MVNKNKKGALEISFSWLFAIIVGAFILFLAIYGTSKLIKSEGSVQSAKTSKDIGILLNPLETGFEEAVTSSISFPSETRIYNGCDEFGNFGAQRIRVEQKNFGEWTPTDLEVEFKNKYIFSGPYTEGKTFFTFSKPFEFPFKISDLIYFTSSEEQFCFSGNIPEDVEDEIKDLNQLNLVLESSGNCFEENTEVCFSSGNCEINVDYEVGYVQKNNERLYFETDALMYGAIFSNKNVYECQVKRLMSRTEQLSKIYLDKELLMAGDCNPDVSPLLLSFRESVGNLDDSSDIYLSKSLADNLEKNSVRSCRLW